MAPITLADLQKEPPANTIFIIGGGVVGSALAFYLTASNNDNDAPRVVVLDKSITTLRGSTGCAPGFVGQLNANPVLTRLAKDSVQEYLTIPDAFNNVGGLEVVTTSAGAAQLKERRELAHAAGLPAELLDAQQAAGLAPEFVKEDTIAAALHFPADGTANPGVITGYFREKAREKGAVFLEANITGLETTSTENGSAVNIATSQGLLRVQSCPVILATGVWTQALLKDVVTGKVITDSPTPILPVAHPYTFTTQRPVRTGKPYPFLRWPETHVYARDHGDHDGLGSYDHAPIVVDNPADSAVGKWPASFATVLAVAATSCLKNGDKFLTTDGCEDLDPTAQKRPFNGIFAVTPDNLPFAGKVKGVGNLWLCAAVWVTSAASTAKLLARQLLLQDQTATGAIDISEDDRKVLEALDPNRFRGTDAGELRRSALARYNDIYNSQPLGY
ncbi:hypothetical protein AJ80_07643 [Polytolypa hystricis UAMH7299]|uniref:FAD dependent oxidoreductase domain-containing protein n=1 Tax=Polytolypa hystricis (strain UAMH7299) TaxID=1447883 RepID=A0A2B7XM23_POLH7|nr:hypothetical protein AJ80_07643 [Polytolypa hystricis UAMH7299]